MNIQFRKAVQTDLNEIYLMFQSAIAEMNKNGIFQWDEIYPDKEILCSDILKQEMYLGEINGEIASAYVLNTESDDEYLNGKWEYLESSYRVIHRLCVNPKFQNRGIGKLTVEHIEQQAFLDGADSIRLDAFTENPFSLKMYDKLGYHTTGIANFRKGKFYLMEKGVR